MVVVLAGQSRIGISTVNLELGKVCIRGQTNRVVIGKKGKVGRASACCVKVGRHCADRHSPTPVLIRVLATRRRVAAVGGVGGWSVVEVEKEGEVPVPSATSRRQCCNTPGDAPALPSVT